MASAQKPTGVTHAVTGNLTGPKDVNLVLAKTTHLEIHNVTPDGLQPVYDISINGRIATMQCIRLQVIALGGPARAVIRTTVIA